jgi:chromosomal replication initiation ATPase DnaA
MTKAEEIGKEINDTLGLNLYENTRTLDLVDARSLYCYILRKDLNYTLYQVRDTLRKQGKSFDHCSVLHNVAIYDEVRRRKPNLELIRDSILGDISPKYTILKKLEKIDDIEKLEQILNCINS